MSLLKISVFGLAGLLFLAWSVMTLLRRVLRIRRIRRPPRRLPLRRGPGAFDARAWPPTQGHAMPGANHRPADIELTDPGILPPPREIRGQYGE